MSTKYRVWKKQEKQIVRLLYRKGLINDFKVSSLYWQECTPLHRIKRKHGRKYCGTQYAPEVHFSSCDYWGECDEHSLVDSAMEKLYWQNATMSDEDMYPESSFRPKGRLWFIKYLKRLPTKRTDSKINKVLIYNADL